jgi:hypothetical protein
MKTVVLESPYSGSNEQEIQDNIEYAWKCLQDSCAKGEAPFASHLMYTRTKDRHIKDGDGWITREEGLKRCEAWRAAADLTVFYTDRGWSRGMIIALHNCLHRMNFKIRALNGPPVIPDNIKEIIREGQFKENIELLA